MKNAQFLQRRIAGAAKCLTLIAVIASSQANAGAPCASGKPCFNAGAFSAEIVNLITSSQRSTYANSVSLRFYIKLENHSAQPVIIGYRSQSSVLIDNEQNRYRSDDTGVSGIGVTSQYKMDSQLRLQPGESRTVTFESAGNFAADKIFGTIYNYDLTFDELQVTPSQQVVKLRELNMNFHNIVASQFAPAPATAIASAPSANTGAPYQMIAQPGQQPSMQGAPQQQAMQQPQQAVQQPAAYQQQQPVYQQQQPVYQQQPTYQQQPQPVYQQQQPAVQQAVYQQPQQGYQQPGAYPQQQGYTQQGQYVDPNAKPDKIQKVNEGIETGKKILGLFGGGAKQ